MSHRYLSRNIVAPLRNAILLHLCVSFFSDYLLSPRDLVLILLTGLNTGGSHCSLDALGSGTKYNSLTSI